MEEHCFKLRISTADMKHAVEHWLRSHFISQDYTVREVTFKPGGSVSERDEFEVLVDPPVHTPLPPLARAEAETRQIIEQGDLATEPSEIVPQPPGARGTLRRRRGRVEEELERARQPVVKDG